MEKQIIFEVFTNGESISDGIIYRRTFDDNIAIIPEGQMLRASEVQKINGQSAFGQLESREQSDIPFFGWRGASGPQIKNPETGEWVAVKGGRPRFLQKPGHDQSLANYETPVSYK